MSDNNRTILCDDGDWRLDTNGAAGPHATNTRDWSVWEFGLAADELMVSSGHGGETASIPWSLLLRLREAHVAWLSARR